MNTTERALVLALLSHYILSLYAQLREPARLTEDGKAKYRRDIEIAEGLRDRLESAREAA